MTTSPTTNIGWQNIMATSWKWLQSYTATCSWACSCACSHSCSHLYLCKWLQEQLQAQLQARLPTSDGKISCQQHGNNSCSHACSHSCSHLFKWLLERLQAWLQIAVYHSITIPISWHNITGGVPTCYTGVVTDTSFKSSDVYLIKQFDHNCCTGHIFSTIHIPCSWYLTQWIKSNWHLK